MENKYFNEVNKNFGFGCMRLPQKNGKIDTFEMNKMVDLFLQRGFNYFDTAHGYHNGMSELAIKECVAKRYPREKFVLTNKLTDFYFNREDDIIPFFEKQLEACGVEHFDFYLMHAQDKNNFKKFQKCNAYETALKLKEQGKIKHFGISFHDRASVLDEILSLYPQIEVVQIQLNYVDYGDVSVYSKNVYEICQKYNKPVIVMEPVKGGSLVRLPYEAQKVFDDLSKEKSAASYAIRFAASFKNVHMVLSGMSNLSQMEDNTSYMQNFKPLDEVEKNAIKKVKEIFSKMNLIPCTSCRYCVSDNDCPKKINIPELFSCYNLKTKFRDWNQDFYYHDILTKNSSSAKDCISCGKCEKVCPQHLPIRNLLKDVAKEFGK